VPRSPRPEERASELRFKTAVDVAATEIAPAHGERSGGPPGAESMFNVKKSGSPEPDIWVRLYRLLPRTG